MSSIYSGSLRLTLFGQSHGAAIGAVLDGLPAGERIDEEELRAFMQRRAPGRSALSTPRREADEVEILSGVVDGYTCGAPLTLLIRNKDAKRSDYEPYRNCPRPGHADDTALAKYGAHADLSGGGHLSGRLTAALCAAGGICLQLLKRRGIAIRAHILSIADIADRALDPVEADGTALSGKAFPVLDDAAGERMKNAILEAKAAGDSLGGVVECAACGVPGGLGDPLFDGMENRVARIVFAVPAVKGIDFGAGFDAAKLRGSENNDAYIPTPDGLRTRTNHAGGILGGITNGMPLIFRAAIKPTPSIAAEQDSIDRTTGEAVRLSVDGRHDPCIVPRAVPCMEAALALALTDAILEREGNAAWRI